MKCIKCESLSTITLRKKDSYCDKCFLIGTNHKFRAVIGKNKILSKNDNVLLCTSGGNGSTVLLEVVHYATSLDVHKKLRICPFVLHVTDKDVTASDSVIQQCINYNFDAYIIPISEYLSTNKKLPNKNTLPDKHYDKDKEFEAILTKLPTTFQQDFINKVKRNLFLEYAKLLKCKFVFTAETTSRLAINLLSNLAIGRGSQIQNDIGFIDLRNEDVQIIRPMKDISEEELSYYMKIKCLTSKNHRDVQTNSLQAVIGTFVTQLQENFPSTVSTVCKTADKIGTNETQNCKKCLVCESPFSMENSKLNASAATNFSRMVSNGKLFLEHNINDLNNFLLCNNLCYSCSSYGETKLNL